MTITWTPSGGSLVVLGDDTNALGSGKFQTRLESGQGVGVEQVRALAFGSNVFRTMRGNVGGEEVFTARKSHSSRDVAAAYYKTVYGYIGQVGTLQYTFDVGTWTMANATFKGVTRASVLGLELILRYQFGITTIT